MPSLAASVPQLAPDRLSAITLPALTWTGGRPNFFPLARAFRRPALTLSAIRLRSSSATAPRTVNTIFPVGVLVSTCSERETNSIPKALKVSSARSQCWKRKKSVGSRPSTHLCPLFPTSKNCLEILTKSITYITSLDPQFTPKNVNKTLINTGDYAILKCDLTKRRNRTFFRKTSHPLLPHPRGVKCRVSVGWPDETSSHPLAKRVIRNSLFL